MGRGDVRDRGGTVRLVVGNEMSGMVVEAAGRYNRRRVDRRRDGGGRVRVDGVLRGRQFRVVHRKNLYGWVDLRGQVVMLRWRRRRRHRVMVEVMVAEFGGRRWMQTVVGRLVGRCRVRYHWHRRYGRGAGIVRRVRR